MRSISAELLTEQQAASSTPHIHIKINGVDYFSRLLMLEHHEEAYRDRATIVLDNSDRALNGLDFVGAYFEIGYGYTTGQTVSLPDGDGLGNEFSAAPGLWVKSQQFLSMPGKLVCILQCEGMWMYLREIKIMITGDPPYLDIRYEGTTTIYGLLDLIIDSIFSLEDLGSADDGIINDFKPVLDINQLPFETAASVIYRLISMTKCYLRMKATELVEVVYPQSGDSVDETYYSDQEHYFLEYVEKKNLLIPNEIDVYCNQGADGSWENLITGQAEDIAAKESYGHAVLWPFVAAAINNQTDADNRADVLLTRFKAEELAGRLVIPHDCRVELYDRVEVQDSRGT